MNSKIQKKAIAMRPAVIRKEEHIPLISLEGYEIVRREMASSYTNRPARTPALAKSSYTNRPALAKKKEGEVNDGRAET